MAEQQSWFALEITVAAEAAEAVEFGLNELDALGTEINNLGIKQPTETVRVIGYFNEPIDETDARKQLNEALRIYDFEPDAIKETDSRRIENVDWLFEWKKHWKPTETAKFIIAPTWEIVENTDKIVVFIEPSMAFGTGTHETTRLCLRAIEENFTGEMSFLDVGTGTGILAIAAKKLAIENAEKNFKNLSVTAADFFGYDTDADSIKIAKENAALNETDEINFLVGSISDETPAFDFVCANITIDVLAPMLSLLLAKAKRILVLSGILREQENLIVAELGKFQISNFKIERDGEWISVTVKQ